MDNLSDLLLILYENAIYENAIYENAINLSFVENAKYKNILSSEGETQLRHLKYKKELNLNENCPIMTTTFEEDQDIITLPCNHCFEPEAISKWLKEEKAECPVCRFKLLSKEIKELKEPIPYNVEPMTSLENIIYNPFTDNYFNLLNHEREINEEYIDYMQNVTYAIFREY